MVTGVDSADVLVFRDVHFGNGRSEFAASVATAAATAKYTVRLGSPLGKKIGTLNLTATGSPSRFETQSIPVAKTSGVHDVYLIPTGGRDLGSIDWISLR